MVALEMPCGDCIKFTAIEQSESKNGNMLIVGNIIIEPDYIHYVHLLLLWCCYLVKSDAELHIKTGTAVNTLQQV